MIQGSKNSITATSPQDINGVRYAFQAWSDGGTNAHDVIAGSTPMTYTATFIPVSADLAVTQTATAAGSQATFSIQARNNGPAVATGVVLNETIPSKLTFVSAPGCNYTASSRQLSCALGSMNGGEVEDGDLVTSYRQKGNIASVVQVSSGSPDIVTGNNSSSFTLKLR